MLVLPETFLNAFSSYAPGLPKIVFNQNGAYSFGLPGGGAFPSPANVLKLYSHPELLHVLCVSKHDQRLLTEGFGIADQRVSRLLNGIETTLFRPGEIQTPPDRLHASKKWRGCLCCGSHARRSSLDV